jgi:transcription initiation factor TFIIIB Brf1 subunit/transcription initiation factor TFIIB
MHVIITGRPAMNEQPICKHRRTRLVAKDKDSEYIECLDCGAILEADEIAKAAADEITGFDESLSDA